MPKPPSPTQSLRAADAPRRGGMRAVSDLVPEVGRVAFRKFGFVQSSIVSRWAEIVGEHYAEVSAPESLRFPPGTRTDGVLTLVAAGAHAPMLQHIVPEIVERVNRFFGYRAVARVAIRQGPVEPRVRPHPPAPPREVPAELGDSLRAVVDPELRAVLEALAAGIGDAPPKLGKIN